MFLYAQTNLQLYRHLAAEGYAAADIATVARAYELGLHLFPGTYRGSGKPFLAHLVGTASVLASLRARTPVLVTGLLMHADLPAAVEMAERLGFPRLAKSLTETFAEVAEGQLTPGLQRGHGESFRIPFASHRLRLRVALSHLFTRQPLALSPPGPAPARLDEARRLGR